MNDTQRRYTPTDPEGRHRMLFPISSQPREEIDESKVNPKAPPETDEQKKERLRKERETNEILLRR